MDELGLTITVPKLNEIYDAVNEIREMLHSLSKPTAECKCSGGGGCKKAENEETETRAKNETNPDAEEKPKESPKQKRRGRPKKKVDDPEQEKVAAPSEDPPVQEKVAAPSEDPPVQENTVSREELIAEIHKRTTNGETRAKVIAIAKKYHPQGRIAEIDPAKYPELLAEIKSVS